MDNDKKRTQYIARKFVLKTDVPSLFTYFPKKSKEPDRTSTTSQIGYHSIHYLASRLHSWHPHRYGRTCLIWYRDIWYLWLLRVYHHWSFGGWACDRQDRWSFGGWARNAWALLEFRRLSLRLLFTGMTVVPCRDTDTVNVYQKTYYSSVTFTNEIQKHNLYHPNTEHDLTVISFS